MMKRPSEQPLEAKPYRLEPYLMVLDWNTGGGLVQRNGACQANPSRLVDFLGRKRLAGRQCMLSAC
jgi:hypothetical protein